ncbi:MAG: electron transport complex subunit RsxC [Candidatus Eremiobacteraeota bacterium]|nr:electron transport complex subunit RsxC [Candidatus Eremiobacteraeota bacterium]
MSTIVFPGGIHPAGNKELTETELIQVLDAPKEVVIPVSQHLGAPATPLVKVKDEVRTGQKIAQAESFITAVVHSSITGAVKAIENRPHPVFGESKAIVIQGSGVDMLECKPANRRWHDMKPADIVALVKEAGVVGMGGAAFPTHVKISPPKGKKVDVLIINGAECEPFLTSDDRLMREKTAEMLEGVRILKRATAATEVIIAVEDNKHLAISSIEKELEKTESSHSPMKLQVMKTRYPQGSEKQLIYAITGREVPSGGLPVDVGAVVQNVSTSYAVYEAVVKGKPLYERIVTITGDCVAEPGNFQVRVGTPFKTLVEAAGGLTKEPVKVISGGPMMGIAQYTLDTPVIKGTSGILILSKEKAKLYEPENCIRCSFCIKHCPQKLMPQVLAKLAKAERWSEAKYEYNLMDCMECGCCTYVCPARIPIVQWIKLAKFKTRVLKI